MFQANGWVSWEADSDLLGVQLDFPLPNYFEVYAMKHYLKIRRKKKTIGEEEFYTQIKLENNTKADTITIYVLRVLLLINIKNLQKEGIDCIISPTGQQNWIFMKDIWNECSSNISWIVLHCSPENWAEF